MTNPFLSPDRVPPPATRTILPGTAQPYYPGDPVPNTPIIGAPPAGYAPATQQPTYTPAPQPAGVVPPGGWNSQPQQIPGGSPYNGAANNVLPSGVQPSNGVVQIQPDQQNLRFAQSSPPMQFGPVTPAVAQVMPPSPAIVPVPQQAASPYPNQVVTYQAPIPQQQVVQQSMTAAPREVRIRAISSTNLTSSNGSPSSGSYSRDGFRPQGSSQVRKPTIISRLTPRKVKPELPASDRFGYDPQYQWLRGQLEHSPSGEWSLRYASGHKEADPLGGNLTIANPQVLGNLQPGDFVQLRGSLDQLASSGNSAGPAYSVSVVQRQRI